jgi:hypothetical protein
MPNAPAIRVFERRLQELGCPAGQLQRRVRELADHHEDLKQAALQEGLSEAEAEARADQRLGEPAALADRVARMLRQSSWLGRHRVLGFCLLPIPATFAGSLLGVAVAFGLVRVWVSADEWAVLADGGPGFGVLVGASRAACCLAIALITALFCWLAHRSAAGRKWALLACACCSLQSFFGYCRILPHSANVGYSSTPNWSCAVIPFWVAAVAWIWHLLEQRRQQDAVLDMPTHTDDQGSGAG